MKKNKKNKEQLAALFELSKKALYGDELEAAKRTMGIDRSQQYINTMAAAPYNESYFSPNTRGAYDTMQQPVDMTPAPNTDLTIPTGVQPQSVAGKMGGAKGMKGGNHPSFAMSDIITPALSLLSGLIPDNKPSANKIIPVETYNQFAYGTGSQAIYKAGGKIKKATGGDKVAVKQSPPDPTGQRDQVHLMDLVNYSLLNSNNLNKEQSLMLRQKADGLYGKGAANQLLDDITIFNQDKNNKRYSGDERIKQYYGQSSQNFLIQKLRTDLNSFSGGAEVAYRNSPDVEVQKQQIQNGMYSNQKLSQSVAAEILAGEKQRMATNYKAGGQIAANGLQVEDNQFTPLSNNTIMINGDKHAQGGTMINYNGNTIEAESGEPLSINQDGSATIWGNMFVPGTKTKFKGLAKKIAKKESDYEGLMEKGSKKLEDLFPGDTPVSPKNRFEKLKLDTARLLLEGGQIGKQDLTQKKERMADYQKAILETAEQNGLDPIAFSEGRNKKAKSGANLAVAGFFTDPEDPKKKKPSMAVRMNNPGNIKYGPFAKKLGAVPGDPATDGGVFAKFPDTATGMKALKNLITSKNYKDLDTESAIKRWTNGAGYSVPLGNLKGRKVKDLDDKELTNLVNVITMGEDGKYYQDGPLVDYQDLYRQGSSGPYVDPTVPIPDPNGTAKTDLDPVVYSQRAVKSAPKFTNTADKRRAPNYQGVEGQGVDFGDFTQDNTPMPSNIRPLSLTQILPELAAFATNRNEPVFAAQYQPNLYQPYQVSFQDRLNANQNVFNQSSRQVGNNPEAQSVLAAQMYGANQQVLGEEFRTNQAISNDVNNKNIGILNDAQLKNLAIRDQQYTRETQARSNTKQQNQMIINSIVDKYQQNRLNNQRMAAYENLTDYRFLDNNKDGIAETATHFGEAPLIIGGAPAVNGVQNPAQSVRTTNRTNTGFQTTTTPSQLQTEKMQLDIEQKRRRRTGLNSLFNF